MLKALKAQLTQLSEESTLSIARDLQAAHVNPVNAHEEQELKNFILCLPYLLEQLRIWFESDELPSELKNVYWHLMAYMYHSVDVLPEEDYGFWGYLDDVYIIGLAYSKTLNDYQLNSGRSFDQDIDAWIHLTRQAISTQTRKLDLIFGKLLQGEKINYDELLIVSS